MALASVHTSKKVDSKSQRGCDRFPSTLDHTDLDCVEVEIDCAALKAEYKEDLVESRKEEVVAALEAAGFKVEGDKVRLCGSEVIAFACHTCEHHFGVLNSCNTRWCWPCSKRYAAKLVQQYSGIVSRMKNPKHLVLTHRDFVGESLADGIRRLMDAFMRLRRREWWRKKVRGGVYSLELVDHGTYWHIHLHVVIDADYLQTTPREYRADRPDRTWKWSKDHSSWQEPEERYMGRLDAIVQELKQIDIQKRAAGRRVQLKKSGADRELDRLESRYHAIATIHALWFECTRVVAEKMKDEIGLDYKPGYIVSINAIDRGDLNKELKEALKYVVKPKDLTTSGLKEAVPVLKSKHMVSPFGRVYRKVGEEKVKMSCPRCLEEAQKEAEQTGQMVTGVQGDVHCVGTLKSLAEKAKNYWQWDRAVEAAKISIDILQEGFKKAKPSKVRYWEIAEERLWLASCSWPSRIYELSGALEWWGDQLTEEEVRVELSG